jgi:hypothetical protein
MHVLHFGLRWCSDFSTIILLHDQDQIGRFFDVLGLLNSDLGQVLPETHIHEQLDELVAIKGGPRTLTSGFWSTLPICSHCRWLCVCLQLALGVIVYYSLARLLAFFLACQPLLFVRGTIIFLHRLQFRSNI